MKMRLMADAVVFDTYAERYVPSGYHGPFGLKESFEAMSNIEGLHGMGITWPTDPLPSDPGKLVKMFDDYGLKPGDCTVINYDDKKWRQGALVTTEKNIRKDNIRLCKEAIDFAAEIPGTKVMVWPAHDGYDYPFQTDYSTAWKNMVDSFQNICSHNPNVTICIEYKVKDPRQRFYVGNIGKMMALFNDVSMDNLKGVIDTGHALQCQEGLGEDVVFLTEHNKLGIVHVNDNYRDADPDLIFGTVAFWDNLEFFYYLLQTDYEGTIEIDYQNPREDRVKSLKLAVGNIYMYKDFAEKLLKHKKEINENTLNYHFVDNMELIKKVIF
ncbi:sugar phosphate isomerase/epimerase family protein [Actinomycetota bacterium]